MRRLDTGARLLDDCRDDRLPDELRRLETDDRCPFFAAISSTPAISANASSMAPVENLIVNGRSCCEWFWWLLGWNNLDWNNGIQHE